MYCMWSSSWEVVEHHAGEVSRITATCSQVQRIHVTRSDKRSKVLQTKWFVSFPLWWVVKCKLRISYDNVDELYPLQSKYSPCSIISVGLEWWVERNDACCYVVTESSFVFMTPSILVQQPSNALSLCEQIERVALKLALSKQGPDCKVEHLCEVSHLWHIQCFAQRPSLCSGSSEAARVPENRQLAISCQPQALQFSSCHWLRRWERTSW